MGGMSLKETSPAADGIDIPVRQGVALRNRVWKNREARRTGLLPVRIEGRDARGENISQVACTLNISLGGTRIVGLRQRLKVGDTVWLRHRQERARFQVIWTRRSKGRREWEAGLRCIDPESKLWTMELCPGIDPETFRQLLKSALREFAPGDGRHRRGALD